MEIFEIDFSRIGSGKIFPEHIETQDWIGYHGTSSYYSAEIERNGFSQAKSIAEADIHMVIEMLQREGIDASKVQGFKSLSSISFSPISEICLAYCHPMALGGQGVGYLKEAIDSLLAKHSDSIDPEEFEKLKSINNKISEIRLSEPIIYAVYLQNLSRIQYL